MGNPFFFVGIESGSDSGKELSDGGGQQKRTSFRDLMMGQKAPVAPRPKVDLLKYEDGNHLKPKVHLDKKVVEGLSTPWQDALVIKLLEKFVGFNTMKDRLTRLLKFWIFILNISWSSLIMRMTEGRLWRMVLGCCLIII